MHIFKSVARWKIQVQKVKFHPSIFFQSPGFAK
uniref:Uncharacterized protein n=1 Tax=Anguilla anguilla TaxID=7936 RepID=A0A0E9W2Y5_ANGAN